MTEELAAGMCVCGRDIPDVSPSDWACSEPCQTAWLHHQANPQYPHPREIRAAAEQRLAEQRRNPPPFPGRPGGGGPLPPIPDGTEVNTDHGPYVRVRNMWHPAGMWLLLSRHDELTDQVAYRRWCPHCQARRDSRIDVNPDPRNVDPATETDRWEFQQQTCTTCGHTWQGRPLVGVIESRGEPWPALRLRLTDGYRSAATTFGERDIANVDSARLTERLRRSWLRLERQLGGGLADADTPTPSESVRASRVRRRQWDVPSGRVAR